MFKKIMLVLVGTQKGIKIMQNTKNYQKTQSRSMSKKNTGNVAIQSIKYLVTDPLAVNYILRQSFTTDGEVNAIQQYSY